MPEVFNKYHKNAPKDAVYIGRPSIWGNPFAIGKAGTREECIEKYRLYLQATPEMVAYAKARLKGKDLVCFCAPAPCHGDVLLEIANS